MKKDYLKQILTNNKQILEEKFSKISKEQQKILVEINYVTELLANYRDEFLVRE